MHPNGAQDTDVPHMIVVVDGDTVLDGDLDGWTEAGPEAIQAALKPGAKRDPWMTAILFEVAQAVASNEGRTIHVTTMTRSWTLTVETP